MAKCVDCGCILEGGICSNCQEELFIIENQSEFITQPLSEEFIQKANEQKEELKRRNSG
jgi:hypothetical protein